MAQRADGMLNKVYLTEPRLRPAARLDPASIAFAFRTHVVARTPGCLRRRGNASHAATNTRNCIANCDRHVYARAPRPCKFAQSSEINRRSGVLRVAENRVGLMNDPSNDD